MDSEAVIEMGEVAMYPLLRRVVSKVNGDKSGKLTFSEFCRALSTLSGKASLEEKLQFAFDLYDINGDGVIRADEMFDVFRLMSPRASGAEGRPGRSPPQDSRGKASLPRHRIRACPGATTRTTRCSRS